MAKAPRVGRVKTRLHPMLGAQRAASLQALLIRHVSALARDAAPTFVAFDPAGAGPEMRQLVPEQVTLFPQRAGHLGDRMATAVDEVTARTEGPIVVIGTDTPTLSREVLARACDQLWADSDAVLGPALDGGYYLLGLSTPTPAAFTIDPMLWGGEHVFAATAAALADAGRKTWLLEPLRDLDTPADATALLTDPALPPAIGTLLRTGGQPA